MAEEQPTPEGEEKPIPEGGEAGEGQDAKAAPQGSSPGESALQKMLADMAEPKQHYVNLGPGAEGAEGSEATSDEGEQVHQGPDEPAPTGSIDYQQQARIMILFVDTATGYFLNSYAGGPGMQHYQASPEEREQMATALADGMAEEGVTWKIPWWLTFLFVAVLAYWPKIREARQRRQGNSDEAAPNASAYTHAGRAAAFGETPPPPPPPAPPAPGPPPKMEIVRTCALDGCHVRLHRTQKKYCSKEHRLADQRQGKAGTGRPQGRKNKPQGEQKPQSMLPMPQDHPFEEVKE